MFIIPSTEKNAGTILERTGEHVARTVAAIGKMKTSAFSFAGDMKRASFYP